MATAALVLSVLALAVSVAAYWRAGGTDIRRRLDELKSREEGLVEQARAAARERMTAAQNRLRGLGGRFEQFRSRSGEGLRARLDGVRRDLVSVGDEVRRHLASLGSSTAAGIAAAEHAVKALVTRQEARLQCFAVRMATNRALTHARGGRFERAEEELEESLQRLEDAESKLQEAGTSLESVHVTRTRVREALTSVRRETEDWQQRIRIAAQEAEFLLASFESEPAGAPGSDGPAGTAAPDEQETSEARCRDDAD